MQSSHDVCVCACRVYSFSGPLDTRGTRVTDIHFPVFPDPFRIASICIVSLDTEHHVEAEPCFKWHLKVDKGFGCWPEGACVSLMKKTRQKTQVGSTVLLVPAAQSDDEVHVEFKADVGNFSNVQERPLFEFM